MFYCSNLLKTIIIFVLADEIDVTETQVDEAKDDEDKDDNIDKDEDEDDIAEPSDDEKDESQISGELYQHPELVLLARTLLRDPKVLNKNVI